MTTTLRARFDGKVLVPESAVELSTNQRYELKSRRSLMNRTRGEEVLPAKPRICRMLDFEVWQS